MSREYPPHPLPAVLALVRDGGKVLLVRRGKGEQPDPWGFPGGLVETGETLAQAAQRELGEETALDAQALRVQDCFDVIMTDTAGHTRHHYVLTAMVMGPAMGTLAAGSDVIQAAWFDLDQIKALPCHPRVAPLAQALLAPCQDPVIAFLSDPATHGGAAVTRIDTHISCVFLAHDRAWKMKKAVKLPFLDFTRLETRKRLCQAELDLNRPTAPGLYLSAVPVCQTPDGGFCLDGTGPAVEWLVAMRRFDQSDCLPALLAVHLVDRHMIQDLIDTLWRSHKDAPQCPHHGEVAGLDWTIRTNHDSMAAHGTVLPPPLADALADTTRHWLDRLAPQLEQRRQAGLVRRCHGDLHAANICRFQGRLVPFDALEFSDDVASVDLFYDLAFLLMDMDCRGHATLASHALNHYLDLSGDYQGAALLPLFLSCRAAIRAHVLASMGQPDQARHYLDKAQAYLSPPPPRLVAIGGLSGSGKSRMARELAPWLGCPGAVVVRSDAIRKQIMGVDVKQRLGADGYTPDVTLRTYHRMQQIIADLLQAGCPVIADAVMAQPGQRQALADMAKTLGVPFDGIWLESPPDLAAQRIQTRRENISDATVEVLQQQMRYDLGPITWTRISCGGTKDQTLALGMSALGLCKKAPSHA